MEKEDFDKKNLKITEDNSALTRFFEGTMNRTASFVRHFDSQTNILIGINIAIAGFSISHLGNNSELYWVSVILSFFSIISVICALYAIHPPRFMRKKGQIESLFYNKKIIKFNSSEEYSKKIFEMLENKDDLIKNYSIEIYNLYKYFYRPKRKLFKISRDLLMIGIILGFVVYIIEKLV